MSRNLILNVVLMFCLVAAIMSHRNFYRDINLMPAAASPVVSETAELDQLAVISDGINPLGRTVRVDGNLRSGKNARTERD